MKSVSEWLDSPTRWTIEIYVWCVATLLVLFLSIAFPAFWLVISIVYLAVVSNYALVLTAAGARQASLARIAAGEDNPTTHDIMKYMVEHTNLNQVTTDAEDPDTVDTPIEGVIESDD